MNLKEHFMYSILESNLQNSIFTPTFVDLMYNMQHIKQTQSLSPTIMIVITKWGRIHMRYTLEISEALVQYAHLFHYPTHLL